MVCVLLQSAIFTSSNKIDLESRVDDLVLQSMAEHQFPGVAVGVIVNGNVAFTKGYGVGNRISKRPVTPNTVFQVGSVTKMFTGNVLAQLATEKRINLFAGAQLLLPANHPLPVTDDGRSPLIIDLAAHTSGLPPYPANLVRQDGDPILGYSKSLLYQAVDSHKTPSQRVPWTYSNFGYGVLATGIESLTGESLSELFRKRIFDPLGMTSSSVTPPEQVLALATPYRDDKPNVPTETWQMGALSGAGTAFSTVNDLCKFIVSQMNESDPATRLQHYPYATITEGLGYGLGCFTAISRSKNTRVIYHGGDLDGYAADVSFLPEVKIGIVVLTNCGKGPATGSLSTAILNATYSLVSGEAQKIEYPALRPVVPIIRSSAQEVEISYRK